MNWTAEQVREAEQLMRGELKEQVVLVEAKLNRARHQVGEMNKTERRYAEHLQERFIASDNILGWMFEPLKLRLATATFYAPDFLVVPLKGRIEFHEVKGAERNAPGRAHWEDDARVKIKVAARLFPWFAFIGVHPDVAGGWTYKTF